MRITTDIATTTYGMVVLFNVAMTNCNCLTKKRVLSYSFFLLETGLPATQQEREAIEFAIAYHDVGLWTGETNCLIFFFLPKKQNKTKIRSYRTLILRRSVQRMQPREPSLRGSGVTGKKLITSLIFVLMTLTKDLIHDIIVYHHKITHFSHSDKRHEEIVNAVRKADLVDFSLGLVRHVPIRDIRLVQSKVNKM
jgi:hypothetical protein